MTRHRAVDNLNGTMTDPFELARIVARRFKKRAGNRISFEELESAALFGIARALITFDPTKGTLRTHAISGAWYAVLSEIRDQHPDGRRKDALARIYHIGIGNEELSSLRLIVAPQDEDEEEAHDIIRSVRKHYGPRVATMIALRASGHQFDDVAQIMRVSAATLYDWMATVRRGPIGTALAKRHPRTLKMY